MINTNRSLSRPSPSKEDYSMKSIGKTISFYRKQLGLTQNELAEKMNVTDKAVSKWERDLSCPDINTISKLAEVLNISVEDLLSAKEQKKTSDNSKDLIGLIFKAISIAMGIAVVVLNVLEKVDVKSSLVMLGIGLTSIGIYLLDKNESKE